MNKKPEIVLTGKSRKIARRVAHAKMRRLGISHPNKPRYGLRSGMVVKLPSFFAQHWKEYTV